VTHPTIGIIGHGVDGSALGAWFASRDMPAHVYDPPKGLRDERALNYAEIVFICVPTPFDAIRGFDDAALIEAVESVRGEKLVVIKSTVLPGTTARLQAQHPQHRFIFNPEFLREATAYDDMIHPDRQIAGVTPQSAADAASLLALLPPAPFVRTCDATGAETAKYMANSLLAIKVAFANEMYDVCRRIGADYDGVRNIVAADPRIGASHLDVLDGGYRGYSGKCLPKDSKSLLAFARALNIEMQVLAAADASNETLMARPRGASQPGAVAKRRQEATNEPDTAAQRAA
jgi:UDPglucose 6-dehydrogenase